MKDPQAFGDTLKKVQTQAQMSWTTWSSILGVDIPEMKMEILLQIQGNMLTTFLNPMK